MKAWEIVKEIEEGLTDSTSPVTPVVRLGANKRQPLDVVQQKRREGHREFIAKDSGGGSRTPTGMNSLVVSIWNLFRGKSEPNTKTKTE